MIVNVKQLKEFLESKDDSKTLSILPIDDDGLEVWISYVSDKEDVELMDTAMGKVVIATLS